jgi:hypothetical protein
MPTELTFVTRLLFWRAPSDSCCMRTKHVEPLSPQMKRIDVVWPSRFLYHKATHLRQQELTDPYSETP